MTVYDYDCVKMLTEKLTRVVQCDKVLTRVQCDNMLTRVQCDKVLIRVQCVNVDSGPMSGLVSVV